MTVNETQTGDEKMTPQTVRFTMRVYFNRIETALANKPTYIDFEFNVFEKMFQRYYKETHRRAYADRATSAEYRMHLTDHGQSVCATDAHRAEAHRDAIDGTWFKV